MTTLYIKLFTVSFQHILPTKLPDTRLHQTTLFNITILLQQSEFSLDLPRNFILFCMLYFHNLITFFVTITYS